MGVVRNVRTTVNGTKPIPSFHACPPISSALMKVTVDTDSGEIDITELIVKASFSGIGVNSSVGDMEVTFLDPLKTNYSLINNFDDVYIYADYADVATTKRFRFKVENKNFTEFNTILTGRGIGVVLLEKNIIYQSLDINGVLTAKTKSEVLQEILEDNFPSITDFTHLVVDDTMIKVNYSEVPMMDIIEEICGDTHYFYLDKDLIPYYLEKGSVINVTEAIVEENMVSIEDNSEDSENLATRVRVYGKSEDGIVIIATADIGTTNTGGVDKDYIIKDNSITTFYQANAVAQAKAIELTNAKQIGNISALMLPTLAQGEALFIGMSEEGVAPANYNISQFSIVVDNNGDYPFTTQVVIEGKRTNVSSILKSSIQTTTELADTENPHDLDSCQTITFEEDSGTYTNTTRSTSDNSTYYLGVLSGTQGEWVSDIYTLTDDPTYVQFKMSGENLTTSSSLTTSLLYYSLDGGTTWHPNPTNTTTVSSGRSLRFKIYLNQASAKLKKIGFYYSY